MNEITSFTSECSICLINIGAERHGVPCCNCKQIFHKKCLKEWYKRQFQRNQTKVSCPNCRHYHIISVKCKNQNCLVRFKKREILIWGRPNPAPRTFSIQQPVNTNNNYFIESEAFNKLLFVFVFILIVLLVFVFFF